jgi:hypothetical protein
VAPGYAADPHLEEPVRLAPTLLALGLLPGCLFDLSPRPHGHHPAPDTAAPVDTGSSAETGLQPATCDPRVRRVLDDLVDATVRGCGHAQLTAAVQARDGEVALQVQVDTLGGAAGPYVPGTTFTYDLATAPPSQAFVRLMLGQGQLDATCTDVPYPVVRFDHVWLADAGTVTLVVTRADEASGAAAPFQADVTLSGVVVDDGRGGRCVVPEVTWRDVALGWLPG